MILRMIHNPSAARKKPKKKKRARGRVTEKAMAKKKKKRAKRSKKRNPVNPTKKRRRGGKRRKARRANPANPFHAKKKRKGGKKRRRNPDMATAKKIATATVAAILTGAGVVALSAFAGPHAQKAMLAGAGGAAIGGAFLSKKRPELGLGVAIGGLAAIGLPFATQRVSALVNKFALTAGIGRISGVTYDTMRGVAYSDGRQTHELGMGSVAYDSMQGIDDLDLASAAGNPYAH